MSQMLSRCLETPFACMPIGVKTETDTQRSEFNYEAAAVELLGFFFVSKWIQMQQA